MAARSDAWFRRVGTVSLTTSGGSQVQGFGAVLPWREERADLWGERPHALGRLPGPLYQFVGSFPQLLEAQGAQLTQGEERYRVLGAQEVTLGGRRLFERGPAGKVGGGMSLLDSLFQLLGPQLEGVELRRPGGLDGAPGWCVGRWSAGRCSPPAGQAKARRHRCA